MHDGGGRWVGSNKVVEPKKKKKKKERSLQGRGGRMSSVVSLARTLFLSDWDPTLLTSFNVSYFL